MIFNGSLEGYVYDSFTSDPIPYANINVNSPTYWAEIQADMNGYYYIDLPNETYDASCWMNGYVTQNVNNIEIEDNAITQNFLLEPLVETNDLAECKVYLGQNYPNPFNPAAAGAGRSPSTTIFYSVREISPVVVDIYNIKGQLVKRFVKDEIPAGQHSIQWNGKDENNIPVTSSIYFYQLKVNDRIIDIKKCCS